MWGRIADSSLFGRKTVLIIGLGGTSGSLLNNRRCCFRYPSRVNRYFFVLVLSCIGFAFSTTFWQALLFRSIGGVTNGNVGVLRTM